MSNVYRADCCGAAAEDCLLGQQTRESRKHQTKLQMSKSRQTCLSSPRNKALLLLFASATLLLSPKLQPLQPTTTSLQASALLASAHHAATIYQQQQQQQRQVGAALTQDHGAHEEGATQDDSILQVPSTSIQVALVSARGLLAFYRPTSESSDWSVAGKQGPGALVKQQHSASFAPCHQLGGLAARIRSAIQRVKLKQRLPTLDAIAEEETTTSNAPATLVAIEGGTFKLNIVILGHRLNVTNKNGVPTTPMPIPMPRLRLHWTRNNNNEPVLVNSPRAKFSQQLINENDLIRQFFSAGNGSSTVGAVKSFEAGSMSTTSSSSSETGNYWLAPYANELALSRLAEHSRPSIAERSKHLLAQNGNKLHVPDDFIQDGQTVDWHRLESYLRLSSHELNLYLPNSQQQQQQQQQTSSGENCPLQFQQAGAIEQVAILQLEASRPLQLEDRGVYHLRACHSQTTSASWCQSFSFSLQILEDIPKLEGPFIITSANQQHQQKNRRGQTVLLEVGDRLSIKCEASGFTLPQITWFLDGQQLNEHQNQQQNQHHPRQQHASSNILLIQDTASTGGGRLRIGDYVSQDNRVHSFVNSSQIEASDGGFYKCQANNGFHSIEQETRIDVRGPPIIARHLQNLSVLINQPHLTLQCPFSGYPISSIEWYYRPAAGGLGPSSGAGSGVVATTTVTAASSQVRARRRSAVGEQQPDAGLLFGQTSAADQEMDQDPDPDRDEWLSQASSMTQAPGQEDYPEPVPDYPAGAGAGAGASASAAASLIPQDYYDSLMPLMNERAELLDYETTILADDRLAQERRKRDVPTDSGWVKFPQSRRHQVHLNGTLIIQEVSRTDQGFYKCRVVGGSGAQAPPPMHLQDTTNSDHQPMSAISNELFLTVLQPPVISPFNSASSLREGMRNFLTCSVIEGDSPVRLSWFKDSQTIEEYILQQQQLDPQSNRIRVETSNEYTSTLYFSHVEFKDNGNYTCMATNKAASVNYTAPMLVNVPPKWIKAPRDLESVAGQSIVIDCQAEAHPNARIWWEIGVHSEHLTGKESGTVKQQLVESNVQSANDPLLHAVNHPPTHYRTIISNSRIHILENASLVIRDVSKSDQGFYLCQAANNFGSLSSLIKLTVNVGAGFGSGKYLVKYVKLDERVELDCDPIGQSPVEVTWLVREPSTPDNVNLLTNGKNYTYQGSSMQQSSSGTTATTTTVTASGNDNIHQEQKSSGLGRRLFMRTIRTDLALHSGAGSRQNQQTVSEFVDHEAAISFEIIRRQESQSELVRLIIKQARRVHSADFVCQATNRFGNDEKLIKLLVQEPPDPVQEIRLVQVGARSVSLDWTSPYNGNSAITSYTVEWTPAINITPDRAATHGSWSHIVVQQPSATIIGLTPLTSYEIRVRAQNHFGLSNLAQLSTASAVINTAEEAPSGPPVDLRATALSSSSVELSWLPPIPPENVADQSRYSIKGYYIGYKLASSNESFIFKDISALAAKSVVSDVPQPTSTTANETTKSLVSNRLRVIIGDLKRASRYTMFVQAFNSAGSGPQSDQLETKTLLNDPPPAPMLRVGTTGYTSIELQWSFQQQQVSDQSVGGPRGFPAQDTQATDSLDTVGYVDGFNLHFKSTLESLGQWLEKRLSPETHTLVSMAQGEAHTRLVNEPLSIVELTSIKPGNGFLDNGRQMIHVGWPPSPNSTMIGGPMIARSFRYTLDQLACGNSYQIYLFAHNSIGSGPASSIIRAKTRGSAPIAPRKQDYILANSTRVTLNLESWMDGGCSINNFEVRYRQLQEKPDQATNNLVESPNWLLVSDGISPERRSVELLELKPETWYSIETVAESAAGKTEIQYNFMTLDKFGRVPAEAIETSLPALFRGASNNSIRSILYNFSTGQSGILMSPLIMGFCMFLLLFATCSLFLIKRYNNLIKDNASIDSRTTTSCIAQTQNSASTSAYHQHHHNQLQHLNHLQMSEAKLGSCYSGVTCPTLDNGSGDHYSMKASPCKTNTTSATIVTGSSISTTNGSSAALIAGSGSPMCNQESNYQLGIDGGHYQSAQCHFNQPTTHQYSQQLQCDNKEGLNATSHCHPTVGNCDSPHMQQKFSTLTRDELVHNHQALSSPIQQTNARFRTMPHRPVSTFLGTSNNQPHANDLGNYGTRYIYDDYQQQRGQQQQSTTMNAEQLKQQQIYSKLRLIYNSNSNYNICQDTLNKPVNEDMTQLEYGNNSNTIDLALLAQQNNQKLLAYSLNNREQQQDANYLSKIVPEPHPSELNALLMECQQQANGYQYDIQPQQVVNANLINEQQSSNRGIIYNSTSVASGSTSNNTNSSQPTTNSSCSVMSNNHLEAVNVGGQQCSKINAQQQPATNSCQQQQQQNATGNGLSNNEQHSDYALPFPPKWV